MKLPQKKIRTQTAEEFAVLANNLIPINLNQAELMCCEVELLTFEGPDLKEKFLEWRTISKSEKKAIERIIN